MATFTVEYYTHSYLTITVEAEDEFHAQDVADAAITWAHEPTSATHELERSTSKDWQVNDVTEVS